MKNISLNFFGEEVSINMPTTLASLRQQISEKFMFSPSDAAEIIVSYAKDLGKKIIQTEQDFVNFISDSINKIDLDISPDSKLYLNNFNSLQKESEDNKKELEEALKKKDEIKKRKETALNKRTSEIKALEKKIEEIKEEKKKLKKLYNKEEKQFSKEEKENNKKISMLKEKLGLNKDKLRSKKGPNIENMINLCLKEKDEEYKKLEQIPEAIITKINKITNKIIEYKLKKMHKFEKELEMKKIELKPEEKEFFINYPQFCNSIGRRINSFTNQIHCETKKLFEEIKNAKKNQKDIICPLKKKLLKKGNPKKEKVEEKKNEEKKEIHWNVSCDGCKKGPITGKRYKCQTCHNFDYCECCYEKEKENHKHEFKVVKPIDFKKLRNEFLKKFNPNGKAIHFGYICDGCEMNPIIGNRYKCTICDDFDYCEACEEKFRNEHRHPFLTIYKPTMDPISIKCVMPENQKK